MPPCTNFSSSQTQTHKPQSHFKQEGGGPYFQHSLIILSLIPFFQISDIVVGQEDVSAKEALLRWAQKTTHRYPGVKVDNFTGSWRDGLAFNAIIHRNRPDLVDWKTIDKRQVRERIDLAFHVMEKEYGVTRLLDPEGRTCFTILVQFDRTHLANLGVRSGQALIY